MNITKQRLNQIIQEEYERMLDEISVVNEEELEEQERRSGEGAYLSYTPDPRDAGYGYSPNPEERKGETQHLRRPRQVFYKGKAMRPADVGKLHGQQSSAG